MLSLSFTPLILLTRNKTLFEDFEKEVRVKDLFPVTQVQTFVITTFLPLCFKTAKIK